MILDTITEINEKLVGQLDATPIQVSSIAVPFYDQQDKVTNLLLAGKRFSIDSKQVFQSLHLTDGRSVVNKQQYGSVAFHNYTAKMILVAVSKSADDLDKLITALVNTSYVVVDSVEDNTLQVLTRYLQVRADQVKNYDPTLRAFAVRYHIEGVSDDDFIQQQE